MNTKVLINQTQRFDVYKDGDKLIKIYREFEPKAVAMYDALTHARVEETGLNVPRIHEISNVNGRWAIVLDYIEGESLYELMSQDKSSRDKYLEIFVDTQLNIHSKQSPFLNKLKDKLSAQIKSIASITDVEKYDLLTRLESMPKHIKLCHCSYTPKNVIISDNGIFVVDWSSARQGNATADVGITYLRMCVEFEDIAKKYLDMFINKTGTQKKYVLDWLPIVAASQLSLENSTHEDLLMKWIDVVDYE